MVIGSKLSSHVEQEPGRAGILRVLLVTVLFVLILLLGLSMVHHRFFQGQREHPNGSVGQ